MLVSLSKSEIQKRMPDLRGIFRGHTLWHCSTRQYVPVWSAKDSADALPPFVPFASMDELSQTQGVVLCCFRV